MNSPFDLTNIQTIEERLAHSQKYARYKTRWFWRLLPVVTLANLGVFVLLIQEPLMHGQAWAFIVSPLILAANVLGVRRITHYWGSIGQPTPDQKAAIENALKSFDYPLAVRLVEELLTFFAGEATLELAATVYTRSGKWHEAQVISQEAIKRLKAYPTSRSSQKELAEHKRKLSHAQTQWGLSLIGQSRYADAEEAFIAAMKTDPSNEWPLINYVEALLYQQKATPMIFDTIQKAEGMWAKNNKMPRAAHATARAWAYAIQGDRPAAEKWMGEATRIASERNHPTITSGVYYTVGLAYQALGDRGEARRAFEQAIEADPKGLSGQLAARALGEI